MTKSKMTDRQFYAIAIFLPLTIVFLLFGTLGIGWVLYYRDYKSTAEWGDSFGFVNALFSGLAFAGVIVAIVIQARELRQAFEEAQTSRVAYQTTAQLQHSSSIIEGIATLSKLQEKLSDESISPWSLVDSESRLGQVKIDFDHRAVLSQQIAALTSFDPLAKNPAGEFRNALNQTKKNFAHGRIVEQLYHLLQGHIEVLKTIHDSSEIGGDLDIIHALAKSIQIDRKYLAQIIEEVGGTAVLYDSKLIDRFDAMLNDPNSPLEVDEAYLEKYAKENFTPASMLTGDTRPARYLEGVISRYRNLYADLATEFVCQCGYTNIR